MSENKIGKKILENLTRGMYEDSLIIYREYIQNSAYQIFAAIAENTFDEELFVDIKIDVLNRNIFIKDNATGIPRNHVAERLSNVADSEKNEEIGLGFRGIGRLGGLAYCSKLRFITSVVGEDTKTIMEWDANKLNMILDDKNDKNDATEVLRRIIKYNFDEPCDVDEHFFIVELLDINEDNTDLLLTDKVREYISENAPVPYDQNKFFYSADIHNYIKEKSLPKNEYRIFVDGEDIVKPYTTSIFKKGKSGGKEKRDDIYCIKMHEFYNDNKELLAWMWYGVSKFEGVIEHPLNKMAGLRLRQANIQIGNERTLTKRFKETRGNMYFIGEVHVVHKNLTPNARRDYFNENETSKELETELEYYFKDTLHSLYHFASDVRSAAKREINYFSKRENLEKKQGKFIDDKERKKLEKEVEAAQEERDKALKDMERYKTKTRENDVMETVFKKIEENHVKTMSESGYSSSHEKDKKVTKPIIISEPRKKKAVFLTEELTWLPKSEQKLISKIYGVISQNLPPDRSEELISKIQEELKHGKKDTSN